MKITRAEVIPVSLPYNATYDLSSWVVTHAHHVVLKLHTDEGIVGLGEASIIVPDRTGEIQETIVLALKNYLVPLCLGEDPFAVEHIMKKLDAVTLGHYGLLYSKCAIDHALYDIMGKALGVPVYQLIGGAFRKKIGVSRSLPVVSPEEVKEHAIKRKEEGYKLLTVKVGFDPKVDIACVRAVREAVGDDFPIEVDPNQGYRVDQAIPTLRRMEEFGIENIEQPVAWWDLDGMAECARALDTPVTADESVLSPADAMAVVKKRAADQITIKLAKSGGIFFSKRICHVAEAAGIPCNMGSMHTFGIGTAAIRHFAAATPTVIDVIGYGCAKERFPDDIITEDQVLIDGEVLVPEGAGLGVELDEEKVKKWGRPL
ncbi:MAG: mandelate racemase/muconate lactonizing enzyme family protein, partial [Nitrospinota bacterium]